MRKPFIRRSQQSMKAKRLQQYLDWSDQQRVDYLRRGISSRTNLYCDRDNSADRPRLFKRCEDNGDWMTTAYHLQDLLFRDPLDPGKYPPKRDGDFYLIKRMGRRWAIVQRFFVEVQSEHYDGDGVNDEIRTIESFELPKNKYSLINMADYLTEKIWEHQV